MTKRDYIQTLRGLLATLPKEERDSILKFYAEMLEDRLEDGMAEEEAVASMEPVHEIAARILEEQRQKAQGGGAVKRTRKPWVMVLAFPVWATLLLVYGGLLLCAFLILGAFLLIPPIFVAAFGGSMAMGLVSTPFLALSGNGIHALCNLGVSVLCAGLAVFSFWLTREGCAGLWRGIVWLAREGRRPVLWLFGAPNPSSVPQSTPRVKKEGSTRARTISMSVAGGCVALGLLITVAALSVVQFDVGRIHPEAALQSRDYTSAGQVTQVRLDTAFTRVEVIPCSGENVRLRVMENDKEHYEIREDGGVLQIKRVSDRKWYENIIVFGAVNDTAERALTMEVPADYAGGLELVNSNGSFEVRDLKHLDALRLKNSFESQLVTDISVSGNAQLENSNGTLTIDGLNVGGTLNASTSFARLSAQHLTVKQSAALSNSNGGLYLNSAQVEQDVTAKTSFDATLVRQVKAGGALRVAGSNGKITVEDTTSGGDLVCETSMDATLFRKVKAGGKIQVANSNGDVTLEDITSGGELLCETSFGAVRCTSLSAPTLEVKNSNGGITLKEVTALQSVRLNTSFDRIDVQRLRSDRIAIMNSNGAVRGSLVGTQGEYRITSVVSNGESNLPQTSVGDKVLEVKTSFDDIEISFEA